MLAELIPTRFHAVYDYIMGMLLVASPFFLDYSNNQTATVLTIAIGCTMFGISLLTRYELGLIRVIPVRVHLSLDILFGVFTALSPWFFRVLVRGIWVLPVAGILEVYIAIISCHTLASQSFMSVDSQHMGRPANEVA